MTGLYPECCVVYIFDQLEQNQFVFRHSYHLIL